MRSNRRYPVDAIGRFNMAIGVEPAESTRPAVEQDHIAAPGRLIFMGIIFAIISLLIIVQLARLQLSPQAQVIVNDDLSSVYHIFYPPRGEIYDHWGRLLAGNIMVYEIGAQVAYVDSPKTIAFALTKVLANHQEYNNPGYTSAQYQADIEAELLAAIESGRPYVPLADFVTEEELGQLKVWASTYESMPQVKDDDGEPASLAGLLYRPRLQRVYPEGGLVSNVLGFVDRLGQGYYGIEGRYNDLLAGTPQPTWFPLDPNRVNEIPEIDPGSDLVLTLDREMQAAVMDILEEALDDTGASSGTVVVMDPNNGEILAMVSLPLVEMKPYWETDSGRTENTPYNRAVSQDYEPGSVFKVLTMASALDAGAVTPDTVFHDTGSISIGGITIHNWDYGAWGEQTMQGCLQHSLNVCLTWVAMELGAADFYSYLQDFGFGRLTGIDLAFETAGRLKLPGDNDWYEADLGTNSFGQGIAVTPIQMIMAISAVANGRGEMVMPHILHSMVRDGSQYTPLAQVVGRPISAETAQILTEMLSNSLEHESSVALVPGYRVAGKTGTAEIAGPSGYTSNETNASFVGWGPVGEPRFLVYVWLEKPESSPWGSVVAAPVFRDVFARLVILADIPPDETRMSIENP
jgi:cell division protein FtsI/penicillin-binding protein 2